LFGRAERSLHKPGTGSDISVRFVLSGTVNGFFSRNCVIHFSLFVIHCSLKTMGAVTPQKPRSAACTAKNGSGSPTASGGNRQRALPARREMPAGAPRRAFALGAVKLKKPPRGVYREKWERFANRLRRESPAGGSPPGGKRLSALPTLTCGAENGIIIKYLKPEKRRQSCIKNSFRSCWPALC